MPCPAGRRRPYSPNGLAVCMRLHYIGACWAIVGTSSVTCSGAAVAATTRGTVTPAARRAAGTVSAVTSMTARSVMMRSTHASPVSGRLRSSSISADPSCAAANRSGKTLATASAISGRRRRARRSQRARPQRQPVAADADRLAGVPAGGVRRKKASSAGRRPAARRGPALGGRTASEFAGGPGVDVRLEDGHRLSHEDFHPST
jgi:hypothetical protein